MRRVAVIGTSGSGKTTLARRLAGIVGGDHVELDSLHWEPDWQEAEITLFRQRVEAALAADAWIVDGNYAKVRDIVWSRADTVVWLDYSLTTILRRLTRRTLRRVVLQEELWSGNRENLQTAIFSKDSLFLWAIKTYSRHRQEYPALFRQPEYAHLNVIRTSTASETDQWLQELEVAAQ